MIDVNNSLILIVDDNPQNIQVLGKILANQGYQTAIARSGQQALNIAIKKKPDLILLDVMMPEMDGFETCEMLKLESDLDAIPVIFLTAKTDLESKIKGFELGASDYITKPFESLEVLKRVETHLRLKKVRDMQDKYNAKLENLLEQRTQSLIIAERHSAFSLLVQGIIHNFRNGLTGVFGYGDIKVDKVKDLNELLAKEPPDIDAIRDLVKQIQSYSENIRGFK